MPNEFVEEAVDQFIPRLQKVVEIGGGRIQHFFDKGGRGVKYDDHKGKHMIWVSEDGPSTSKPVGANYGDHGISVW